MVHQRLCIGSVLEQISRRRHEEAAESDFVALSVKNFNDLPSQMKIGLLIKADLISKVSQAERTRQTRSQHTSP